MVLGGWLGTRSCKKLVMSCWVVFFRAEGGRFGARSCKNSVISCCVGLFRFDLGFSILVTERDVFQGDGLSQPWIGVERQKTVYGALFIPCYCAPSHIHGQCTCTIDSNTASQNWH